MVWFAVGDKNTRFFHQFATQRRWTNTIFGMFDENGRWCSDEEEMADVASHYFENIFCSAHPHRMLATLEAVEPVVCDIWNQQLVDSFTAKEVKRALFDMHPSKAPGPDGMSSFFFKKFWRIVGPSLTSAVLSVLNSNHLLQKVNHTHIVLIPKKKNLDKMGNYRPISLCNVIYKLISKVLANRLKTVLAGIISDSQNAFVLRRLITDNVEVAFEILNSLKNRRTSSKGLMALKLNMSKAYDRVKWSFLELIMRKLGFAERWVALVMECITTNVREEIHQFWGSTSSTNFGKYLGLPPVVGRAKKLFFNEIKERVAKRIHGWKERFLSKAGREILIKAIAQAIPTYSMSCFLLPKTWCSDLNGMMAKYWWGQNDTVRKIHWVKWESLCMEKSVGGLGFKQLYLFNRALLANILAGQEVLQKGVEWQHQLRGPPRPVWRGSASGSYIVRLGYNVLESKAREMYCGESSHANSRRRMWRKLWKLRIPGKCLMAQNTWAVSRRVFSKMPNSIEHFSQHFQWILLALDKEAIMEWIVITWCIWRDRNHFIFHKIQLRPEFIRDQGLDLLIAFQSASGGPPGS
uniref:Reverse transcriptase domain-containing protein n=1 Tax=Fagus sylvatica TaxID=28930 RepID=A0A2N9IFV5_FAGSY